MVPFHLQAGSSATSMLSLLFSGGSTLRSWIENKISVGILNPVIYSSISSLFTIGQK